MVIHLDACDRLCITEAVWHKMTKVYSTVKNSTEASFNFLFSQRLETKFCIQVLQFFYQSSIASNKITKSNIIASMNSTFTVRIDAFKTYKIRPCGTYVIDNKGNSMKTLRFYDFLYWINIKFLTTVTQLLNQHYAFFSFNSIARLFF